MFEIMSKDLKTIRNVFEAISAVVSETQIRFDPEGIFLDAIDDGRICLIGVKIDKVDYDSYKCDQKHTIGLNIEDVVKILRRGSAKDEVTFSYTPETKRFKILLKPEKAKKARTFALGLVQLNDSGIKPEQLEKIEYNAKVSIPVSYLDEAIKDADIFSEVLMISFDREGITFKAEGQIGESEAVLESGDEGVQDYVCKVESGDNSFALTYLKHIAKAMALSERVELSLNANTPIKVKYSIMSSSSIRYYLAPRVDEQEEDYDEANAPAPEPVKKTTKSKKSSKKNESKEDAETEEEPEEESED